jgi:hypothetical protein
MVNGQSPSSGGGWLSLGKVKRFDFPSVPWQHGCVGLAVTCPPGQSAGEREEERPKKVLPKSVSPRRRRRRKSGRRGPERFDADHMLKRLVEAVRLEALGQWGTEKAAEQAVADLVKQSSETLAEMVAERFGVRRSGKTYLRNSQVYRRWRELRERRAPPPCLERSGTRSRRNTRGEAELETGALSLCGPNPRHTKRRRDKNEKAHDAAADDFLKKHGIDPRDMPAE